MRKELFVRFVTIDFSQKSFRRDPHLSIGFELCFPDKFFCELTDEKRDRGFPDD